MTVRPVGRGGRPLSRRGTGRLLGPAEAQVYRLKNYYRHHFQLQSPSPGYLHQVLRQVVPTVRLPSGVELTIDVDPQDML